MGGFRAIAFPLFLILIAALPLLLIGSSALITLAFVRASPALRRTGLNSLACAAGFALLDALLLKSLPWLGLSFGPVLFSLFFFACVRAGFYALWTGLQIRAFRKKRPVPLLPFLLVNALLTSVIFYGYFFEPFHLQVTRVELRPPAARLSDPLRIVQLSDLHVERTTRRELDLVQQVRDLKPDLIVLTGDYLNISYLNDPVAIQDARDLFMQLSAPYGVYAVRGSVDGERRMNTLFSGTPVIALLDQVAQIELPGGKLALIGVSDRDNSMDDYMIRELSAGVPDAEFRLLLYHTPDEIQVAAQNGIDLYLAGHTHGGQIRLPVYGAIVTDSAYGKRYEAGRYQVGETILYVSRGIGMEGGQAPRARFLAPPEIVVIDLIPD